MTEHQPPQPPLDHNGALPRFIEDPDEAFAAGWAAYDAGLDKIINNPGNLTINDISKIGMEAEYAADVARRKYRAERSGQVAVAQAAGTAAIGAEELVGRRPAGDATVQVGPQPPGPDQRLQALKAAAAHTAARAAAPPLPTRAEQRQGELQTNLEVLRELAEKTMLALRTRAAGTNLLKTRTETRRDGTDLTTYSADLYDPESGVIIKLTQLEVHPQGEDPSIFRTTLHEVLVPPENTTRNPEPRKGWLGRGADQPYQGRKLMSDVGAKVVFWTAGKIDTEIGMTDPYGPGHGRRPAIGQPAVVAGLIGHLEGATPVANVWQYYREDKGDGLGNYVYTELPLSQIQQPLERDRQKWSDLNRPLP